MVENAPLPPGTRHYDPAVVEDFIASALRAAGVATEDAALVAEENRKIGIPITPKILEQLHRVAERLRINDTL